MMYKILFSDSPANLTTSVEAHIADGWLPQGGVSVGNSSYNGQRYAQAMVMVWKEPSK